MTITKQIIDSLHYSELREVRFFSITNSLIKTFDFISFDPNFEIVIENCIIQDLLIHSCWFKRGLLFKNNQVINPIDFQMGGHNDKSIRFIGNVFCGFVNFFDCAFKAQVELRNNIFVDDTNLLGNINEGFHNTFEEEPIIYNNVGNISVDRLN